MRRQRNLFLRIYGLSAILAIILLWFFYDFKLETRKASYLKNENFTVNLQKTAIEEELEIIIDDLIFLAEHTKYQLSQNSDFTADAGILKRLTSEFKTFSYGRGRYYDQIRFLNITGDEIIRINLQNGKVRVVADDSLQNKADRYYIKDILKLQKGDVYISQMDLNIEHGIIETPKKPMIRLGTLIFDKHSKKRGSVLINFLAESLLDQFDNKAEISVGENFFLNNQSYWLRSEDHNDEWAFMYPEKNNQNFANLFPSEWDTIATNQSGMFSTKKGYFAFETVTPLPDNIWVGPLSDTLDNTTRVVNTNEYYWKLVSYISPAHMNELLWPVWKEFIIAIVIISILLLFMSLTLSSSIIKRQNAELQLKEINENLEIKVLERTRELNDSKEKAELSERYFRQVLEKSPLPIVIINERHELEFINNKFTEQLGYTYNNFTRGHEWWETMYPDSNLRSVVRNSLMNAFNGMVKHNTDFEVQVWDIPNKEGSNRTCEFYMVPIGQKSLIVIIDITERKNDQIALINAKQRAEKSDQLKIEFLHNMSHEVRTPLNGILGFSNLLNSEGITDAKRKNYIKIIHSCGDQLLRIINDILEISKLETKKSELKIEEVTLNQILKELFSIFEINAKQNKLEFKLHLELSEEMSIINTDKSKLNKAISCLLENAFKYTTNGRVELGYTIQNENLEIYIFDTGIGINQDKFDQIFERFAQEEAGLSIGNSGLGLGLSIAKENIELIGGKISLESNKGNGTKFIISIPYNHVNLVQKHINNFKSENINKPKKKYRILIADDDEVNYQYLNTVLTQSLKIDCDIYYAKNGKEAVDACTKYDNFDFVLMDLKMPIVDGFKATEQIKPLFPHLPIIAQTAYSLEEDIYKAKTAGCADVISKPISESALKQAINKYL